MSLPKRSESTISMRDHAVSINFEKLDDGQLIQYFEKPQYVEDVFRELLRRFQVSIYTYTRNMLSSHDDADDATQNTFIKVWKGLPNFRGESKLRTWIYRIASNECINLLRKKKNNIDFDEALPELSDYLTDSPYMSSDDIEMKLVLKYFEDLSYDEISELTQTSVGALKSSYHHAVKKLEIYLNVLR
jgi:RNA polymerase sigma-70 factor (ECF subfamily)